MSVDKKDMLYKLIGARIRYYRTLNGLSQKVLAKRVNLSDSAVGRIERGDYNESISLSTLVDIANGLKIDVQRLLTMDEDEERLLGWK